MSPGPFRLPAPQPALPPSSRNAVQVEGSRRFLRSHLALAPAVLVAAAGLGTGIALLTRPAASPYGALPPGLVPVMRIPGPMTQPSGHVVTGVVFLPGRDPAKVGEVRFRMEPKGAIGVQAQFVLGGPWYGCGNDGDEVTCETAKPPLERRDVSEFTVRVVR